MSGDRQDCHRAMNVQLGVWVALTMAAGLAAADLQAWVTTGDGSKKLARGPDIVASNAPPVGFHVQVQRNASKQTMEGFGAAMTNSAAYNMFHSSQRNQIMNDLFSADGIAISYIRLPIGSSDLNAVPPYTYDDIPPSDTDFNMTHFSIDKDKVYVIPMLKQALTINPDLKIVASPWSPPAWFKTTKNLFGGEMRKETNYLAAYALYFLKFIQAYAAVGITIDALTVQNEPMYASATYPTEKLAWQTEQALIRDHLGPLLKQNNIKTKILIYDHNWDGSAYPEQILSDKRILPFVAGVAWHGYGGKYDEPAKFHANHQNVGMYFTEISGGTWDGGKFADVLTWDMRIIVIGQTRSWCKTVLFWNLALDENHGPFVDVKGCTNCRGVVTVLKNGGYRKEIEYYVIGHVSKFVKHGAVRLDTAAFGWDDLQTVAFQNPDKSVVVVVQNPSADKTATFTVDVDGQRYQVHNLPSQSVATFLLK